MEKSTRRQLLSFVLIGGGLLVFGTFLMWVMVDLLHWGEHGDRGIKAANAVQLAVTLWLNCKLNKRFTFTGCESPGMTLRFMLFRAATLVAHYYLTHLLVNVLGWNYLVVVFGLGVAIGIFVNFATAKKFVFTRTTLAERLARAEHFRLSRRTALWTAIIGNTFLALLLVLTGPYFVPVMLVVLALLCQAMATFFLAAQVYPHRDEASLGRLRLPAPDGPSRKRFAILMPARKGEPQQYAYTLLNAFWTQRRHGHYRLVPLLYGDDTDGARNVLAVCRTLQHWLDTACGYAELRDFLADELSRLPQDGSPLTTQDQQMLRRTFLEDQLIQVIIFPVERLAPGQQRSKPLKLNEGWRRLRGRADVFGILDAETLAAEDLLVYVDQAFQDHPDADGFQGPVQLVEPRFTGTMRQRFRQFWRRWYAWHNLLEYHRCFMGLIPLQVACNYLSWAGNTIFITTDLLDKLGGWPETLTEDNAAGTKAAVYHSADIRAFFNQELASLEETPVCYTDWMKQRERWNAGFLQTLMEGEWRLLPELRQRLMAFWVMSSPFLLALTVLLWSVTIATITFGVDSPPSLVLVMYLPVATMLVSTVLLLFQMHEFSRMHGRKVPWYVYPFLVVTQIPYQVIQGWAAFRACLKYIRKDNVWHTPQRSGDNVAGHAELQRASAAS